MYRLIKAKKDIINVISRYNSESINASQTQNSLDERKMIPGKKIKQTGSKLEQKSKLKRVATESNQTENEARNPPFSPTITNSIYLQPLKYECTFPHSSLVN